MILWGEEHHHRLQQPSVNQCHHGQYHHGQCHHEQPTAYTLHGRRRHANRKRKRHTLTHTHKRTVYTKPISGLVVGRFRVVSPPKVNRRAHLAPSCRGQSHTLAQLRVPLLQLPVKHIHARAVVQARPLFLSTQQPTSVVRRLEQVSGALPTRVIGWLGQTKLDSRVFMVHHSSGGEHSCHHIEGPVA